MASKISCRLADVRADSAAGLEALKSLPYYAYAEYTRTMLAPRYRFESRIRTY